MTQFCKFEIVCACVCTRAAAQYCTHTHTQSFFVYVPTFLSMIINSINIILNAIFALAISGSFHTNTVQWMWRARCSNYQAQWQKIKVNCVHSDRTVYSLYKLRGMHIAQENKSKQNATKLNGTRIRERARARAKEIAHRLWFYTRKPKIDYKISFCTWVCRFVHPYECETD